MKSLRPLPAAALGLITLLSIAPALTARQASTAGDWLSPAYPYDIQSAKKAERIAFLAYDEGKRNVYTAAAPAFTPVRVTSFMKDDGTDMTDLEISADGSTVTFVRGHALNRDGWVANPNSNPDGAERAIWAARTAAPGVAWRVVEAATLRARAEWQLADLRARRPDPSRARDAGRSRPRRGIAARSRSSGVGHERQSALLAGRPQDRLRQPARRSQLRRSSTTSRRAR